MGSRLLAAALVYLGTWQAAGTTTLDERQHRVTNITVYRVTPRNYTGIRNMDAGDSRGDLAFGLFEYVFPLVCPDFPDEVNCQNVPILNIPNFNVYTEFLVEVDQRFGEYAECNPNPDTGVFACAHLFGPSASCWYDNPIWNTTFGSLCNRSSCRCDVLEHRAVGSETCPLCWGWPPGPTPPDWPSGSAATSCQNYSPVPGMQPRGLPLGPAHPVQGGAAECCTRCESARASATSMPKMDIAGNASFSMAHQGCSSWSMVTPAWAPWHKPRTGLCQLWVNTSGMQPCPRGHRCLTGFRNMFARKEVLWVSKLSSRLNGTWFSFQEAGECPPGERPVGDGRCFWRLVEARRTINATCLGDRLGNFAEQWHPVCFQGCGKDKENRTSACYVQCLFEAFNGNASAQPAVPQVPTETLTGLFTQAFETGTPVSCPGPSHHLHNLLPAPAVWSLRAPALSTVDPMEIGRADLSGHPVNLGIPAALAANLPETQIVDPASLVV